MRAFDITEWPVGPIWNVCQIDERFELSGIRIRVEVTRRRNGSVPLDVDIVRRILFRGCSVNDIVHHLVGFERTDFWNSGIDIEHVEHPHPLREFSRNSGFLLAYVTVQSC